MLSILCRSVQVTLMESLVVYLISDSDDSDKEDVRDVQQVTSSAAPSIQTTLNVNKTDSLTNCITVTQSTACTATLPTTTIDKRLDPVATEENDAPLHTGDFFGLNPESSDDSGDDVSKSYFVKGHNVFSKPICNSRSYSCKTIPNSHKSKANFRDEQAKLLNSGNPPTCQLPLSRFWSDNGKVEDWSKPDQIWGNSSNYKRQLPEKVLIKSETESYSRKKEKPNLTPHNDKEETVPLTKSCFYIHHKISQSLHKTLPCKSPTHKYLTLAEHDGAVNRVRWARAEYSHLIASASMDTTVKIWNVFSTVSHCVQTFFAHTKAVRDITWSPSGKEILSCGYDRTARLNDVVKGVEIVKFEHQDFLTCVKYHPVNPNYILLGSKDLILCWDIRCPETCMKTFGYKHNFGQVQDLMFIRDGREVVISTSMVSRDSADRSIMVYDFSSGVVLSNQVYQERYICPRLAAHPQQAEMMAQSGGNYLCLFSTIKPYKMNRCKRFEGHKVLGYSVGCDYSADGQLVVSGSTDSKILIWNHQTAVQLKQLGDPHEIYLDVAWHPVLNSTVASCTWGGHIDIWQ